MLLKVHEIKLGTDPDYNIAGTLYYRNYCVSQFACTFRVLTMR
jgi:hypothetical protein